VRRLELVVGVDGVVGGVDFGASLGHALVENLEFEGCEGDLEGSASSREGKGAAAGDGEDAVELGGNSHFGECAVLWVMWMRKGCLKVFIVALRFD
jgi:hypothetical protein